MKNAKSTELFKALQPEDLEFTCEDLFDKNQDLITMYFLLLKKLDSYFEEFKIEFQDNESEPNFEKYITSKIYHFTERLNELEQAKIIFDKNPEPIEVMTNKSTILYTDNHQFIKCQLWYQIKICKQIVAYLKNSNYKTPTIAQIVEDTSVPTNIVERENKMPQIQTASSNKKGTYNGSKIDLIILFLTFHFGEIISFKEREHLVSFIETNFNFRKTGKDKDITSVTTEISEIFRCVKDGEKDIQIYWDDKQYSLIEKIISSLKNTIKELEKLPEKAEVPPKNSNGGWPRKKVSKK